MTEPAEQEEYSVPPGGNAKSARRGHSIMTETVIGFLFAGTLLVFSLGGRAELTAANDRVGALRQEIALLEEEHTRLQIAYGSRIDLAAIERYAVEELGMQHPLPGQIRYEETVLPDRAAVTARERSYVLADRWGAFVGRWQACLRRMGRTLWQKTDHAEGARHDEYPAAESEYAPR